MIYENHHPAIIPIQEWELANSKIHKNHRKKITPWNEFRNILKCSECGSSMVIMQSYRIRKKDNVRVEWKYLKCSAYRRGGKDLCVNHAPIMYEDFRELMLKKIKEKANDIELNFQNTIQQQKKKEIASLETKLMLIEKKNGGLVDLYLEDKLISKQEFQLKRKEYENEIATIKDKLFIFKQENNTQMPIKNIKEAFEQFERNEEDLHHIFKQLLDEIIIYPDGKLDITYTFAK